MRALPLLLLTTFAVTARAAESVEVTNFPRTVEVHGRLDTSDFRAFEDRAVPAHSGSLPRSMVSLGVVDATGRSSVILSLAAWASVADKGSVLGLLLIPDVQVVRDAVDRDGSAPFALRLELPLDAAGTLTVSSADLPLAFPRWRAWLYNTGSTEIRAHAFMMLRN